MARLALLPLGNGAPVHSGAEVHRIPRSRHRARTRYYAFLSYSHQDEEIADWLHCELEKFRVPSSLAGRLTANGVIPKRLTPIFRDEHDLSAADDLGDEIEAAIAASQFMIVLCSPAAAKSRWTNAEVELFKRSGREGCLLAAVASGDPFASDVPGREEEECFPAALRFKFDRRGRATAKRAEPLAADLRGDSDERRMGFLKLVAGMLGVGLDELVQRETTRRHRHVAWLAAASLAGMAVTSGLAITAIHARDAARDQRREAEGLVAFMLGDLKDKLEPIGRLDALDGVGSRVLAYYSKQDTSDLPDAALLQRSRALSLMAEVANLRGQMDVAERLYREAISGTAEAIRRNPKDPRRLYDHAQNYFYLGDIARLRGDFRAAETNYREYNRLAEALVALQPDNMRWRIEAEDAQANLGIALFDQRRFAEADQQFQRALATIEAVVAVNPSVQEYQLALSDTLAWIGDTKGSEGQLDQAAQQRARQIQLLQGLIAKSGDDVAYRERIIPAYQGLGRLFLARADTAAAIRNLQTAVVEADRLIPSEPQNALWQGYGVAARLNLADAELATGNVAGATTHTQQGCDSVERLVARDHSVVAWRRSLRFCFSMRAQLALRAHAYPQAAAAAQQALRFAGSDRSAQDVAEIARAHRLAGDAYRRLNKPDAARIEWAAGIDSLPDAGNDRPGEMAERVALMERLNMTAQMQPVANRLSAMGYRRIAWLKTEGE